MTDFSKDPKAYAELLTRTYEQKVLGHPIRGFADGAKALQYMLGTEEGKRLMREAVAGSSGEAE